MCSRGYSNYESFLGSTCPLVPVHYYTQTIGSSSSSVVASGAEAVQVRRPRIALGDIWSTLEEWSCYGVGVPLSLENVNSEVIQYYSPTLSAIQIFTIKPFADDSSSSGSSSTGKDGTETRPANDPNSFSNYRHPFLPPDRLGYLYFQYNDTERPFDREPLTSRIAQLAEQYSGLNSLTSSDLSPYSWISIAWYPIYQIPSVKNRKELSACFLTYHSLKPFFPEKLVEDDKKVNEHGMQSIREVGLPSFGVLTYKAFGNAWINQKREMHEKSATSWLETLGFVHSDGNFFKSRQFFG